MKCSYCNAELRPNEHICDYCNMYNKIEEMKENEIKKFNEKKEEINQTPTSSKKLLKYSLIPYFYFGTFFLLYQIDEGWGLALLMISAPFFWFVLIPLSVYSFASSIKNVFKYKNKKAILPLILSFIPFFFVVVRMLIGFCIAIFR